jgi:hypothetical protein
VWKKREKKKVLNVKNKWKWVGKKKSWKKKGKRKKYVKISWVRKIKGENSEMSCKKE